MLGDTLSLTFILPMPGGWTDKKRKEMDGRPHQQVPDLDNLVKAFKDALFENDCHVWQYGRMQKVWGKEGGIIVHV